MIDDNKITEAFKMYNEKVENELAKRLTRKPTSAKHYADTTLRQCAFIAGVKWMQEEFLKDLWHPASDEPEGYDEWILLHYSAFNYYSLSQVKYFKSWKEFVERAPIENWLYIDDLFQKEGGEHD